MCGLFHVNLLNLFCLDSGLSILSCLVKLQYLNFASCSKLTDSCLQHITGWAFYKQSCKQGSDWITDYVAVLYQQLQLCARMSDFVISCSVSCSCIYCFACIIFIIIVFFFVFKVWRAFASCLWTTLKWLILGWCCISSQPHPACLSSAWTRQQLQRLHSQSFLPAYHSCDCSASSRLRYSMTTVHAVIFVSLVTFIAVTVLILLSGDVFRLRMCQLWQSCPACRLST